MSRTIFENSKAALAFAGMVVVGAGIFAATQGDMTASLAEESAVERKVEPKVAATQPAASGFAEDAPGDDWYNPRTEPAPLDALIDDARGFDPLPDRTTEPGSQDFVILESKVEAKRRPGPAGIGDPPKGEGPKNQPSAQSRAIAADLEPGAKVGSGPPR